MMQKRETCSVSGKKPADVLVSHEEEEVLSNPLITKEDVQQHPEGTNLLKLAGSDNLRPSVLEELAEEISGVADLICNKPRNTGEISELESSV